MNLPGFTAEVSLAGLPNAYRGGVNATGSDKVVAAASARRFPGICVPWYCCEEQKGCGWYCHVCFVNLEGYGWIKVTTNF